MSSSTQVSGTAVGCPASAAAQLLPQKAVFQRRHAGTLGVVGRAAVAAFDVLPVQQRVALFEHACCHLARVAGVHTVEMCIRDRCYLLEEERTLLTGDHVMQGSTVVINPPDGDMQAYMASLHALLELDLEWLAPGHGFLMAQPHRAIRRLIAHREQREARVMAALQALGPITAQDLLGRVYDDVPANRLPVAARSLLAHLLKLRAEGLASQSAAGMWAAA